MGASEKKVYNARSTQMNTDLTNQTSQLQQQGADAYGRIQPAVDQYTDIVKGFTSPARFDKASGDLDSQMLDYGSRVSGLYNNAGYTPQEKAGMVQSTVSPIAGAFAGADAGNARQAAVTNNPMAAGSQRGVLARDRARMTSDAMGGMQKTFGDARIAGQQNAVQLSQFAPQMNMQTMQNERGMVPAFQFPAAMNADLYGTAQQGMQANNSVQAQMLDQQKQMAINPGFWSKLALAGAQGAAGAATAGMMK